MADGNVSGSDNALGWFIITVLFLICMAIIWHYFHYDIKSMIRWVRWSEMWVVSWFVSDEYTVPVQVPGGVNYEKALDQIYSLKKEQLSNEVSANIGEVALYPLRWIFSGLFILLALWCMFRGPNTQFRKTHGLDSLIKWQSQTFPYIAPFVDFNPSNQPPRPPGSPVPAELPAFGEALGPEEWLAYEGVPVPDGVVDQVAAQKAFRKQLGRPWRGWAHLPKHKQVLLAAFCLKSVRKRDESDKILGELSRAWTHKGGLALSSALVRRARQILKNREISGKVLSKCNQHAYENTAIIRGLLVARDEGGVLSPSQFVWLRAYDRYLWYCLNNLGRQTYHMEALGAMAHFRVEKLTQRPVIRARVENAVEMISKYMASDRARPIPALDYSKSKKRGVKKVKGT
ncbi:MAG: type IV secretion system protein [Bdellovibrionales bacterium]